MHSSRYIILSNLIQDRTGLPTQLSPIVLGYLAESHLPGYIASFFLEKNPHHAKTIAEICFENLNKLPNEIKHDGNKQTQRARADGVANALCELDDDKIQFLFQQWEFIAHGEETESKNTDIICSRYRLLIAYYLPTPTLLTDDYGMTNVRAYLDAIDDSAPQLIEDRLVYALIIKLEAADHIDPASFNTLLDRSTIHLNLFAADLTAYSFAGRNLDYACLKNTTFHSRFINHLPASCAFANLEGVAINRNLPNMTDDFLKIMTQAQGGLDIVYGPDRNTLLHVHAENPHNYYFLVENGADTTKKNAHNQLPFHRALTEHDSGRGRIIDTLDRRGKPILSSNYYAQLLQSLPDEELLALKKQVKDIRNETLTLVAKLIPCSIDGLYLKWKMGGLIKAELALRTSVEQVPAASPAAVPVSESKAINTVAPVVKAAPASPGKVSSLSLLGDQGVLQASSSSGLRPPFPLAAFRH